MSAVAPHFRAADVFAAAVVVVWRVVHSVPERLFFGRVRERLHATLRWRRRILRHRSRRRWGRRPNDVLVSFRPRVGAAALFRLGLRRRIADDVESLFGDAFSASPSDR